MFASEENFFLKSLSYLKLPVKGTLSSRTIFWYVKKECSLISETYFVFQNSSDGDIFLGIGNSECLAYKFICEMKASECYCILAESCFSDALISKSGTNS